MGQRDEGLLAHHLDILLLDVGVRPEQLSCEVLGAARPVDSAADASLFRIGHRLPLALVRKRTGHARAPTFPHCVQLSTMSNEPSSQRRRRWIVWRRGCQFSLLPYQDAVRVSVACAHSLDVPLQIPLVCAMPLEKGTERGLLSPDWHVVPQHVQMPVVVRVVCSVDLHHLQYHTRMSGRIHLPGVEIVE